MEGKCPSTQEKVRGGMSAIQIMNKASSNLDYFDFTQKK